ncbi:4-hydroxybenzoate polyprenyltransferase [Amphibacillus marinus]|uniref:4-hydroxybenzoate polyprenyltransferase n=1 Tax=Amphibacillus marinus TaxID=872970 RepID=A0A1H8RCN9_9BACI|nr:UbiA-like polyprenyltransferase [Amphibacillus marinus]SEO63938.1 4-hydroxybenzoate polyprenyltransferase [Amphibacillus marinus]
MVWTKGWNRITEYGTLVMFSHTIFSLSFALIAMLLAANGLPEVTTFFWILVAFLSARTGANALNRVIDAEIDAKNPRTADRQLPQGQLNKTEVLIFTLCCFIVMLAAAWMLNPLCFYLAPIALFLMVIYSYTKRFTWMCHVILGISCAAAPVGAWLAITGEMSWLALFMGAANTAWVAGFDIIYGAQDYQFDKANGLRSIPETFGLKYGLYISSSFHVATVFFLLAVGFLSEVIHIWYFIGLAVIAVLFIIQHQMISPTNLKNVKIASYGINQLVSIVFLVFGLLDIYF